MGSQYTVIEFRQEKVRKASFKLIGVTLNWAEVVILVTFRVCIHQ